jgi:rubredoxin
VFDEEQQSRCTDCHAQVTFPGLPSDASCPSCGLATYITEDGVIGRYPEADSFAGGVQGKKSAPDPERPWHPAMEPQEGR